MVSAFGDEAWRQLDARAQRLHANDVRALAPMMILVPHPDDETLGCGGLIAMSSDLDLKPLVVFITDGSASHRGSPSWPPERLAEVRRQEALAALMVLGVPKEDVRFLDWPDGEASRVGSQEHARATDALVALAVACGTRTMLAPWDDESHDDHRAANRLARAVCDRLEAGVSLLEYLVWGWTDADLPEKTRDRAILSLYCGDQIARRRTALACHRTQMTDMIADATDAFLVPDELAALTERPTEILLARPRP